MAAEVAIRKIDNKPCRILIIVSKNNAAWDESWTDIEGVISSALETLRQADLISHAAPGPKLLVKEKWHLRVFIVVDIFHAQYDYSCGHLQENNDLPVIVVRLTGKRTTAEVANEPLRKRTNRETSEVHNLNGYEGRPPYIVDHTKTVPVYPNPRDLSLLSSTGVKQDLAQPSLSPTLE